MNFILTPLLANKYPPSTYGVFGYLYSWAAMLNAFLAFGMETTFFRYLQKRADEKEKVYANTFLITLFTSALLLLTLFVSFDAVAGYLQRQFADKDLAFYLKVFVFILIADALAVIPFARIRAEGRPIRFACIKLANIATFVGLNLLFILVIPWLIERNGIGADWLARWYRPGWIGYVFLSNLTASVITLLMLIPEILKLQLKWDGALVKDMLGYSFPILIANFSFIVNENLDKLLLKELLPQETSARDVGIYTMCSKLAVFMSIAVQAFRLGAEPFFFSYAKEKNAGSVYSVIMDYLIIAMSVAMVGLVANIEILKFFTRGGTLEARMEYWSGLPIVPILIMAYVFLGVYMNLSIWYKLSDQTRYGVYISGFGAIVTIVLNFVLIPRYGYIASAWITLTTYGSMMVLSYILGQRHYPIPYHLKKNITYLAMAAVISWMSFSVFHRDLIIGNVLFILFLLFTFLMERKQLAILLGKRDR